MDMHFSLMTHMLKNESLPALDRPSYAHWQGVSTKAAILRQDLALNSQCHSQQLPFRPPPVRDPQKSPPVTHKHCSFACEPVVHVTIGAQHRRAWLKGG